MAEIVSFITKYPLFSITMLVLNILFFRPIAVKISIMLNSYTYEAKGGRKSNRSLVVKIKEGVKNRIEGYESGERQAGIYQWAKEKMRKAGFNSVYAPSIYLLCLFVLPVILFALGSLVNYPDFGGSLILAVVVAGSTQFVVYMQKRDINHKFQNYAYKIYKYLNNQISAGMSVTDAAMSVYQVIDDRKLKNILILLAARYKLTMDMDYALRELKKDFDNQEADTLAMALKQGVDTGDNKELLDNQEDFMFDKYLEYLKVEVDKSSFRSAMAALMFVAIIVIIVMVPMFNDTRSGISNIFSN